MTPGTAAPAAASAGRRCAGYIPQYGARPAPRNRDGTPAPVKRPPPRRCGLPLDPALAAAGETTHPGCAPAPQVPPELEDAITAWLAGMTPEGLPAPDPWQAAAAAGAAARAAAAAAGAQDTARQAERRAAISAEVDRLAAETRVTGAAARARLWPDGPPWEHGKRLRPRPADWPPGTIGAAANRGQPWQRR